MRKSREEAAQTRRRIVTAAAGEAVETIIELMRNAGSKAGATYLSTRHRDNPAGGCPLAAIGSELGRGDEKTRAVATDGFLKLIEIMARQYGKRGAGRRRAMVAVSTMIGALTMSRIVTDPELSAEILEAAEKSLTGP
jgi:TetR/AcrR family transcriptional repressor of nem operon